MSASTFAPLSIVEVQRRVDAELDRLAPVLDPLAALFADAGHELALVGGPVRDAMLGRAVNDLDFTTSALPDETERLLKTWSKATWDMGRDFGTIGARAPMKVSGGDQLDVEITTYRSEAYDPDSRKPVVEYGDNLAGDLGRRDFTVNAMAVRLAGPGGVARQVEDPYGGVIDLAHGVLRTPGAPEMSFSDDPLRMMRAARFAAQLGFTVDPAVVSAMTDMAGRIGIISAERVRDELVKLICAPSPRLGLTLLVETGIAAIVLPELPALKLESDEHHRHKDVFEHSLTVLEQAIDLEPRLAAAGVSEGPDFVSRFAALMHDVGKPRTRRFVEGGVVTFHHHDVVGAKIARKRMKELRFSNDEIDAVCQLIELHLRFHGYGTGEWTDSAVRRYVRDAGDQLERLHILTRADCTTRNRKKAERLARTYDALEERIGRLAEEEELGAMRPALNGDQIMALLGLKPGREVGEAYKFLLELRMDEGVLSEDDAAARLRTWWSARD
ncbi:CCA tRNA nucleotidyltransferase [Nocardioides nematodiphilus]|uniref:CCA tRNA nucleotidyltransferase n=1 Tax=Nocardioides nematodiphilus TaxID=2849669 RepID=UPI001CD940F3|nr:CCA tRNA nucleotidyltransferase [Nocardioides nematodiphilus]MCA1984365.1 CCA tRNA nucleotidyltransferase [Nocardioides nematodiphilus]